MALMCLRMTLDDDNLDIAPGLATVMRVQALPDAQWRKLLAQWAPKRHCIFPNLAAG